MLNLESTISTDTECAWIAGEKMQRPWIHWLHLHSILHSFAFMLLHVNICEQCELSIGPT